jgi:hexosaminidase
VSVGADAQLSPAVNESYALTVPADGRPAQLTAPTQWGALRGLETFLQLVVWEGPDVGGGASHVITGAPVAVADAPRFTHRGVLIDTSFNFLTMHRVKEVLDSMPVTKSNILHWHIVDDPAWPMESTTYPSFSSGAYASVATYSVAQQAEIAAYALERGVMILLEFDVPGHCASWAAGSPTLVTACDGHQTLINPVGEPGDGGSIYGYLDGLMKEYFGRIGSPGLPLIHLGGDEVTDYTCWLTSHDVQAWAKKLGINGSDPRALRSAFTGRVQAVAAARGLRAAFWEESFLGDFGVNNSAVVTPWVHPDTAGKAAAAGHDVLNYVGYYLDQWVSPARTDVDWYNASVSYGYIDSWRLLYTYDPTRGVPAQLASKVLGGVASAWGDNVDSSLGAAGLLFPRSLAVGEVLWSPEGATRVPGGAADDALDGVAVRMEHARCRLAQRGVGAAPVGIAGTYGFCWSPRWEGGGGGGGGGSGGGEGGGVTLSAPALAFAVIFAAAGGATAAAFAARAGMFNCAEAAGVGAPLAAPGGGPRGGGAPQPPSSERMVALDQFRGVTMIAMLVRCRCAPAMRH